MSDKREAAIEAIQQAGFTPSRRHAEAALDALLAILPSLGLRVVPVEMTRDMAWALDLTDCDAGTADDPSPLLGWNAPWRAAIAAAPNPLEAKP